VTLQEDNKRKKPSRALTLQHDNKRKMPSKARRGWWELDILVWQEWRRARTSGLTELSWLDWYEREIEGVRARLGDSAQRIFRKKDLPKLAGYGRTKLQDLMNKGEFPKGFPLSDPLSDAAL
jgi:hypothetical protein